MEALQACHETEIYVRGTPWDKRMLSYVDLGWVRDVRIADDTVHIDLVLPYAGRRNAFGWFADNMKQQIRERIEGVGDVEVTQVHEPAWAPEQMSHRARWVLNLDGERGKQALSGLPRPD